MARLQVFAAALAATLIAAPCGATEEVEIIAESAPVKVRETTVATVKRGERYRLVQRKGAWTAIVIGEGDDRKEGWVLSDKLRAVVDPSLTDESPAPDAPSQVYAAAELVQMPLRNQANYLFFRLSLTNASDQPARLTIADLALRIGEKRLPYLRPLAGPLPINVTLFRGEYPRERADSLPYFEDCVFEPNDTVARWLSYDLAPLRSNPREWFSLTEKPWVLEGKLGEHRFTLDLTESESRALAAKLRKSQIEPSVRVIEFSSEINLLNFGSLTAIAEKVPTSDPGFVLLPTSPNCSFEYEAAQRWQGWLGRHRRDKAPPIVVQTPGVNMTWRGQMLPTAASEAAAALAVLGRRAGTGPTLVRHLHDEQLTTRIGAAEAMGPHLAEADVLTELLAAVQDQQPALRAAALRALGDRKTELPARARQEESADTAAVVGAMRAPEAAIRNAAAYAAGAFNCPRARTALAAMLDDKDKAVQLTACASLGELKAKEGVEKLQALRASPDRRLSTAALDALQAIGQLSEVDALLEKIKSGHASGTELQALAKTKDRRALPAIVAELKGTNLAMAAYSLADLGDREAVGPLIDALERARGSDQIPLVISLGKLDDPRAIEPIREALATAGDGFRGRISYVEALLKLNAPGAVDEAAKLLKSANNALEKPQLLQALGHHGGEQAIAVIEPLLDDREVCRHAAYALALLGSPKVLPVLEKRLLSADYSCGPQLLQGLGQKPQWFEDHHELLKKASDSPNAATQAAARKVRKREAIEIDD